MPRPAPRSFCRCKGITTPPPRVAEAPRLERRESISPLAVVASNVFTLEPLHSVELLKPVRCLFRAPAVLLGLLPEHEARISRLARAALASPADFFQRVPPTARDVMLEQPTFAACDGRRRRRRRGGGRRRKRRRRGGSSSGIDLFILGRCHCLHGKAGFERLGSHEDVLKRVSQALVPVLKNGRRLNPC